MKSFKILIAIAVAIFATTSLVVSLTSPIKSLLDVNVKALTQDEGGTGGIGGGEGSVLLKYGPERTFQTICYTYRFDYASNKMVPVPHPASGTYCEFKDLTPCSAKSPC